MEFFIFDINFNRKGIIDVFSTSDFTHKYDAHDQVSITVDATDKNIELLNNKDHIILTKSTDVSKGYLLESVQYEDETKLRIVAQGWSLSSMLGWRVTDSQQRYTGSIEEVLNGFVNANAVNPTNVNRIIPNLILSTPTGIDIQADEMYEEGSGLDTLLWEICKKYNVSYEILMDHSQNKYVFKVFAGADRSALQSINPRIIFAKKFDNVNSQSYVDDISNYRSTGYILGGEKDDGSPTIVTINDNISGYDRRELYIEATDLQRVYTDDDGVEVYLTQEELEALLLERGSNTLSDYQRVRTFESDINTMSRYVYGRDYFLGDIVTNRNDELGVITHSRVMTATEKYDRNGYALGIEFGTSIPTLIDKIKRKVRK